jgi:putative membrane protein
MMDNPVRSTQNRSRSIRFNMTPAAACVGLVAIAWLGNALYAIGTPNGPLKYWSPALVAGAMVLFLVVHGRRTEGNRSIFTFVAIVFLIGWTWETISILTGFPFGRYHYTQIMAPFLGHVPVSVMPAYCVMGYISWSTARIILSRVQNRPDAVSRFVVPIVAALLMVLWDASMDPLRATVEGRWVWLDGGPHFGVPLLNFSGWLAVTWMMFQSHALLHGREKACEINHPDRSSRLFWISAPLMYLAFPVEYVLNPLVASGRGESVLVNGSLVSVASIQLDISMLTGLTMIPIAVIAIVQLLRHPAFKPDNDFSAP